MRVATVERGVLIEDHASGTLDRVSILAARLHAAFGSSDKEATRSKKNGDFKKLQQSTSSATGH